MRAAPAPPELRSATGYVMQPVARTMPGDVISPVHNQAVYRHGTGRPSMVGENGHRTTLPTQLRTPRTANVGHVMRPTARAMPGDVMSPVHNQAVCRHDTSDRTTLHDQLRGDVMSLVHTQAVCRHDTGPLDRTACNVMLPVYNKTECRHDTSYAGMVRENGPRTTLPLLLRGLVPERGARSERSRRSISLTDHRGPPARNARLPRWEASWWRASWTKVPAAQHCDA